MKKRKRKIVVENYIARKEEIDEFCRKGLFGYEVYPDGRAVIIVD